jgi:hypothetical protein
MAPTLINALHAVTLAAHHRRLANNSTGSTREYHLDAAQRSELIRERTGDGRKRAQAASQIACGDNRNQPLGLLAEFFSSNLDRLLCGSGLDRSEPLGWSIREVDAPGQERLTHRFSIDYKDAARAQPSSCLQAQTRLRPFHR